MKRALSIAGSDCSGGAGIQADLKTFLSCGVYGMSVLTAVTAQNTVHAGSILLVPPELVAEQLDAVFQDIGADCVKIGMPGTAGTVRAISEKLNLYRACNVVVDTPVCASTGRILAEPSAVLAVREYLFPLADLITPNLSEAGLFTGRPVEKKADMVRAAEELKKLVKGAVMVKGGHLPDCADDLLFDGENMLWLAGVRYENPNTHGSGCTLSAAAAAGMAKGLYVREAAEEAKRYITGAIESGLNLGRGCGPLDHGWRMKL